jgi:phage terminase large subunit GpA-like protein
LSCEILRPRPKGLTVTEWADRYRFLSPEASAFPGKWHTSFFPYLRKIMDAFVSGCEIVFMKSAQVGATEVLLNFLGYIIHFDPGPTLVVYPDLDNLKDWSKDRLDTMLRDTPVLNGMVTENQKDSGNTIRHKKFPGGHVKIASANSKAGLKSKPIRNVLLDEIDEYPPQIDAIGMAVARSKMFPNRRIYKASTPENRGSSPITQAFEASNMQYYYVPCPHCHEKQRLIWEQVRWLRELPDGRRVPAIDPKYKSKGRHLTATVVYVCEFCGAEIDHKHKARMVAGGEWRATAAETGIQGFHISELYAPLTTWEEIVKQWLVKKQMPNTLKEFMNQTLGLPWEEPAEKHDPHSLMSRCEPYTQAPASVLIIDSGVDVHDDRLEIEVVGWARNYESWSLDWRQFLGDPTFPDVWREIDEYLLTSFTREDGVTLPIAATLIDSGHHTNEVYRFCKPRFRRRVMAIKGVGRLDSSTPIAGVIKRENKLRCPLLPVNVDEAKERIFGWLSVKEPGPAYMHFPSGRDEEYFKQLTSEDRVERRIVGRDGVRYAERQYVKRRSRNEALDLRVYALAGIEMIRPKWDTLAKRAAAARGNDTLAATDEPVAVAPLPPKARRFRPRTNWVTHWR